MNSIYLPHCKSRPTFNGWHPAGEAECECVGLTLIAPRPKLGSTYEFPKPSHSSIQHHHQAKPRKVDEAPKLDALPRENRPRFAPQEAPNAPLPPT